MNENRKHAIANDLKKHLASWNTAAIILNPEDEFEWSGTDYSGNLRLNVNHASLLPTVEIQLLDEIPLDPGEILKLALDILEELNNTVLAEYRLTNLSVQVSSDQWLEIRFNGYQRL